MLIELLERDWLRTKRKLDWLDIVLIVAEISLAGMVRVQARQFSKNWQVIINRRIASLVLYLFHYKLQVDKAAKEIIKKWQELTH